MENPFYRKIHVHDFRELHLDERQEHPFSRLSHVAVFHRRLADNRCRINRVFPLGYAGDMENRIIRRRGIIAGMILRRGPRFSPRRGQHILPEQSPPLPGPAGRPSLPSRPRWVSLSGIPQKTALQFHKAAALLPKKIVIGSPPSATATSVLFPSFVFFLKFTAPS